VLDQSYKLFEESFMIQKGEHVSSRHHTIMTGRQMDKP
jgi:hypothetical protein